jgi:hypothetical protein
MAMVRNDYGEEVIVPIPRDGEFKPHALTNRFQEHSERRYSAQMGNRQKTGTALESDELGKVLLYDRKLLCKPRSYS